MAQALRLRSRQPARAVSSLESLVSGDSNDCITGSAYIHEANQGGAAESWRVWVFTPEGHHTEETLSLAQLRRSSNLVSRDLLALTADSNMRALGAPNSDHDRPRPLIIPRSTAVLLSLSHIKAAIHHDRMILFDVHRSRNIKYDSYISILYI